MSDSFCLSGLSFVAFYLSLERDSLRSTLTHQHRIILLISHLPTDFLLSIYPTLNLMILTLLLRYDLRTVKHRKRTVLVYNSIHLDICKHTCGEGNGTPLQYFAWKIPWTEEPGRLQSMGSLRIGHNWATSLSLFTFMHWRRKWQPTSVFLPRESQEWGSLVGCRLWGRTESDTTEAT